jgi:hypothetical protein
MNADAEEIRQCVENWVAWRDAGFWDRFATVWHSNGWMTATWFQGPAADFVRVSKEGFERGVNILHALNGWSCDIRGTRAISQANMNIFQRAPLDGVDVDVTCWGRFYDFFEQRGGRWAIVRRQPIYEKDRLDPVDPSATLTLDPALLSTFPDGYKHLGYLQSRNGFKVKLDLPGLRGAEIEKLYREGAAWLAGAASAGDSYRTPTIR